MQPKAAKKIGGMTPKKMTGGEDTKEFDFDGTKYTIKKTQEKDELKICVSAPMPGAEAPVISDGTLEEVVAGPSEEDINNKLKADGIEPGTATPEQKEEAKRVLQLGGKKKRKSSKKRKSMKKKGGMKRKSMKVKA